MADQAASQADIQKLEHILDKLYKVMSSQAQGTKPSYTNAGSNDPNYKALENVIKNNGSLSNEIQKAMAKMKAGSVELSRVIDAIDQDTKHMSDTQRKAAAVTVEYIKQTGNAVQALRALTSLKNDIKSFSELPKKIEELNKDIQAQVEARAELRKKAKSASAEEAKDITAQQAALYDNFVRLNQELDEAKKSASTFAEEIKDFNNKTKILTDAELEFVKDIKNLEKDAKKYNAILATLSEGSEGLSKGINSTAGSLASSSGQLESAAKGFKLSLMNAGKLLVTSGIPILFKDYLAELRNNIKTSNYGGDAMMGISETERSDLIGNNRTNLRVLGGGSEYKGFDKNLQQLQNVARQFGVYGKEGLETALKYQQQAISQGSSGGNIAALSNRMTFMHNLSEQVGETDDALSDYMDTLNKTGMIQTLNAKYANKSELDRQKSVDKEIQQRISLNKAMGVNIEQLKAEEAKRQEATYGGLTDMVKRIIGAKMYTSVQGRLNPSNAYTSKESALMQEVATSGSYLNLTPEKQKAYLAMQNKHGQQAVADRTKAYQSGNMGTIARYSLGNEIVQQMGFDQSAFENTGNMQGQTVKGRGGAAVIGTASDSYMNTIDKTKGSLGRLGDAAITAAEKLRGIGQSPAGPAASAAGNGTVDFIEKYLALRGSERFVKGGLGAARGAISAGGVALGTDVGALAAGGIGGIATIVAGVLGAAAVGAAIGTLIHHLLPDSVNMSMGKGIAHVLSAMGVDSATTALADDARGEKAASLKYTFYDYTQGKYINSATPPTPAQKAGIEAHQAQINALKHGNIAGAGAIQTTMPSQAMQTIQQSLDDPDNKGLADIAKTLENMYGISKEQLEAMKKKNKEDKENALQEKLNTLQDGSYYKAATDHFNSTISSVRR